MIPKLEGTLVFIEIICEGKTLTEAFDGIILGDMIKHVIMKVSKWDQIEPSSITMATARLLKVF
jgi:hypothetical protein